MFLLWLLLFFVLFQIGIRVWFRVSPQAIPFGWTWLLENPWRKWYRQPESIASRCEIKPSDTVLELGCGSGLFTPFLAAAAKNLIAQDVEARYVAQAQAKNPQVTFLVSDARALALPDQSVDVAVLISVLPEIRQPVEALKECWRVLKTGGRLVISQELFEPEYVTASTTDTWARQAGFVLVRHSGNAWVYFRHYQKNT